jgi:hypothetical protein
MQRVNCSDCHTTPSGQSCGCTDTATFKVYGVKAGVRVITATVQGVIATFAPISPIEVDGFEFEMDAGLGSCISYSTLEVIDSGTVNANNGTGIAVATVPGNYYGVLGSRWWWSGVADAYGCIFIGVTLLTIQELGGAANIHYHRAVGATSNVTVADNIFGDNSGSSAWAVYNARVEGRRIRNLSAVIVNPCGLDGT